MSMISTTRFKQEPCAALSFINPVLDQTRRRNVPEFVDELMNFSKAFRQRHVVLTELCEHIEWVDIVRIVVEYSLNSRYMTD